MDKRDDSSKYKNYTDSTIGANWLETHVYIYLNTAHKLPSVTISIVVVLYERIFRIYWEVDSFRLFRWTKVRQQKTDGLKIESFYASLALKKLRPPKYRHVQTLPYDLYCPSTKICDEEYVCGYCKKIVTTKALLRLHYRATQRHASLDDVEDEEEEVAESPVVDGPCLISNLELFLTQPMEIIYE